MSRTRDSATDDESQGTEIVSIIHASLTAATEKKTLAISGVKDRVKRKYQSIIIFFRNIEGKNGISFIQLM